MLRAAFHVIDTLGNKGFLDYAVGWGAVLGASKLKDLQGIASGLLMTT